MAGLFAAGLLAGPSAQARALAVVTSGGALAEAEHDTLFKTFVTRTGIPLVATQRDEVAASLLLDADKGPDVLLMRGDLLREACQQELLNKIDWDVLGGKDGFLPQGVQDCGLGATIVTFVLAWDRDKFASTPTWADFWDIAKLPGKRGLRDGVRSTLEFALMADGVAPADMYRTLRTDDGVDRAFRKLDQLKPYIVWWNTGADAARILGNGEVLLTSAPNGEVARVALRQHRNLGLQWSGSLIGVLSWAVRRDSSEQDQAAQFLKLAAEAGEQVALQAEIPYGGVAKGANDGLSPEVAEYSSGTAAHLAAGLWIDERFWQDNLDRLTQRFEVWKKH